MATGFSATPPERSTCLARPLNQIVVGHMSNHSHKGGVPYHELPQEIQNIMFNWAALIGSGVNLHAIALGYGSLYNHADQANCAYTGNIDDQTLTITSLRNIQAGEELTINYDHPTGQGEINAQSWFAQRGLKPI
ncbi:MAG: SET domain-containing protein [Cyanobacteria bacterium K_DeepCast_0m_m1_088]|nr:SET domain-containing protein [Cyanobacteria bacterium K_DeepCast_0m_m1_088]